MNKFLYIIFYKPYNVLCQFSGEGETLSNFNLPKEVYPAGRLDKDSEGLLFLTNDGIFNQKIANPKAEKTKTYWVQVENIPSPEKLRRLSQGVMIKDYKTKPCKVKLIDAPHIPERTPPIRYRKSIQTAWLEIKISEGKNRQVRRMTAAIGHPTLRLVRVGIGKFQLLEQQLAPGEWKYINREDIL